MPLPAVRVTIGGTHVTFSEEAEVVVGRGPGAGVDVADERVLREHAVLQRHPGAWVLVDRSGGALFLDGFPVPMLPIAEPVEVRLADAHDGPRLELRPATLDGGVGPPIPAEATRVGIAPGTLYPPSSQIDRAAAPASATVTIGRAPENDVVVDDLLVSRHHAELRPLGHPAATSSSISARATAPSSTAGASPPRRPSSSSTSSPSAATSSAWSGPSSRPTSTTGSCRSRPGS